jgi:hypothetical protein
MSISHYIPEYSNNIFKRLKLKVISCFLNIRIINFYLNTQSVPKNVKTKISMSMLQFSSCVFSVLNRGIRFFGNIAAQTD